MYGEVIMIICSRMLKYMSNTLSRTGDTKGSKRDERSHNEPEVHRTKETGARAKFKKKISEILDLCQRVSIPSLEHV